MKVKSADPQIQRIHWENADRMLLASFVSGLIGSRGHQVRISQPRSVEEALKIALPVQEADRQERFHESFDMNMSYRLAFCKTIAHLMSHNNRRQLPRRK